MAKTSRLRVSPSSACVATPGATVAVVPARCTASSDCAVCACVSSPFVAISRVSPRAAGKTDVVGPGFPEKPRRGRGESPNDND